MKTTLLLTIMALFGTDLHGEDEVRHTPTVRLFSDGNTNEGGIQVSLARTELPGVNTGKIEFEVMIVNWMSEEVFVEVTELDDPRFCLNGGLIGFQGILFPDNVPLLKRLHAATVSADGKRSVCGCAATIVKQSRDMDLSKYIGRTGTLEFPVRGFYRSNGKHFSETIELNFKIIAPEKSEKTGDETSAAEQLDKVPAKAQSPTPAKK